MLAHEIKPRSVLATIVIILLTGAGAGVATGQRVERSSSDRTLTLRIISSRSAAEVLADDLVGAKVTSPDGEELAEVENLIVHLDGRLTGLILSVGGFLGIGGKLVAVPWSDVRYAGPDRPLVMSTPAEQLEAAPRFRILGHGRVSNTAGQSESMVVHEPINSRTPLQ